MPGTLGASKQQYPSTRSNMPEILRISGTFQTNGAAPVRTFGRGYTVTQQGTGLYRVTPNINTPRIVSAIGSLIKAATSVTSLEVQDMLSTNNYVTFRVINPTTGAAAAPGAVGDLIAFDIIVMTVKLPVV
jgi:hypothetical protein